MMERTQPKIRYFYFAIGVVPLCLFTLLFVGCREQTSNATVTKPPTLATAQPQEEPPTSKPNIEIELQKLDTGELTEHSFCGTAVCLTGKRLIVGVPGFDGEKTDQGELLVYEFSDTNRWLKAASLIMPEATTNSHFGYVLTAAENFVVVGCQFANKGTGAAYIFERSTNGTWTQTQVLTPDDSHGDQLFGCSMACFRNRLVIGARQDRKQFTDAGSAYVFERQQDGQWIQTAKLVGSNTIADDQFGGAVAVSEDFVVVGSRHNNENKGSVYVFAQNEDGHWTEQTRLQSDSPQKFGQFGNAVAVSNRTIVVGEWHCSRGVRSTGVVHVFEIDRSGKVVSRTVLASNEPRNNDCFGYSVAIHGQCVAAGDLNHGGESNPPAVHLYAKHENGEWNFNREWKAPRPVKASHFASAISLNHEWLAVGDESYANETGAAYLIRLPAQPPSMNPR